MTTLEAKTKITAWGNSKGLRIPRKFLETLHISDNQEMQISVKNNSLVITPVTEEPNSIHELFAGWKDDGIRGNELDWGMAKGEELKW